MWLGLDYWFWVQRSFGKSGAKLCNYIASGDTQRTYEYICYEKFLISGAKDNFRIARIGMSSRSTRENLDLDKNLWESLVSCRATVSISFTDEFNDYMTKLSDGFRGGKGGQKGVEFYIKAVVLEFIGQVPKLSDSK